MDKITQYTGMIELLRDKPFCTRSKYSVRRPVQRLLKFLNFQRHQQHQLLQWTLNTTNRGETATAQNYKVRLSMQRHSTSVRVFVSFEVKLFQDLNATVVFPVGTRAVTSDVEPEETATHIQRDRGL